MSEAAVRRSGAAARLVALCAAAVAIVLAGLAVYLPTPGDYWIRYDNENLIRRQPRVQALALEGSERVGALVEMFTTVHWDLYQPLMTLSLATDYALFGWNKAGFHAHALALHLAIALGTFALALRLAGSLLAAWLAATLLVVHPVMLETVTWTVHRTILVAAAWILAGSHAYLSYARRPERKRWLALASVAYALSLLGKALPSVLFLPLLIDVWVGRRLTARVLLEKAPLALAVFGVSAVNLLATRGALDELSVVRPIGEVLLEAPAAFVLNAANTVWPARLTLFYPAGEAWHLVGWRWLAVAAALVLVAWGGRALWRRGVRGPWLAPAAWVLLLAPSIVAGSYRETVTADRYSYVGALFLALGLASALAVLAPARRGAAVAAGLVVATALGWQARADARLWRDETLLWREVIERTPHPTAYGGLCNALWEQRQRREAVAACEQAIALLPRVPALRGRSLYHENAARYALATALAERRAGDEVQARGDLDRAVAIADAGLALWPELARFEALRGRALLERGDVAEAAVAFERALAREPGDTRAATWLAIAHARLGRRDLAISELWRTLGEQHANPLALETLARLLAEQGDHSNAAAAFYDWALLRPGQQDAHAGFFASLEHLRAPADLGSRAALLEFYAGNFPDSQRARRLLGLTYAEQGRALDAERVLRQVLAADPEDVEVKDALERLMRPGALGEHERS